jgi:hypothetical protein
MGTSWKVELVARAIWASILGYIANVDPKEFGSIWVKIIYRSEDSRLAYRRVLRFVISDYTCKRSGSFPHSL